MLSTFQTPLVYTAMSFESSPECCKKNENFQMKKFDIFLIIFAQNIDCGYTLESRRGGSKEY